MKGNLNSSAYHSILDNLMLSTLWEQFGESPFLFEHDCAPVHKAKYIKVWLDEFGVELGCPIRSPNPNPIRKM